MTRTDDDDDDDDDDDAGERDARTRDRSILGLGLNLSISRRCSSVLGTHRGDAFGWTIHPSVIDSIRFGFGTDSYRIGFVSFVIRFGVDSVKG